jgi:hypothetical protein
MIQSNIMKSKKIMVFLIVVGVFIIIFLCLYLKPIFIIRKNMILDENISSSLLASVRSLRVKKQNNSFIPQAPITTMKFADNFSQNFTVKEISNARGSSISSWWLNSGALFNIKDGVGSTILGDLSRVDPWRVAYSLSNPLDTDNGYHPQNIFRLVQKDNWENFTQEVYFKIVNNNLSDSPNRNASNGLLLFNRFQDQYNLYYTGIRVDGYAVIKKKINGNYYTMDYKPTFSGNVYDRNNNPNLLPTNSWIGLRSVVSTNQSNTVDIKVYIDKEKTGNWILVAEATDNGKDFGGLAITQAGHAGIRTDFMDVLFDDYKISSL